LYVEVWTHQLTIAAYPAPSANIAQAEPDRSGLALIAPPLFMSSIVDVGGREVVVCDVIGVVDGCFVIVGGAGVVTFGG
jgi:hypothetical protein